MRLVVVVGALAAVLAGVAGCGGPTVGQASPVVETTAASSPPPADGGLPVNRACSLLSSAELQELGASSPPTQQMVGTGHGCEFNSDEFSLGVLIRTNVGLAGFDPPHGSVHGTTIGVHQARQVTPDNFTCEISIGVSASSRVDVNVTGDGTTNPCPTALTLARMVERRLP